MIKKSTAGDFMAKQMILFPNLRKIGYMLTLGVSVSLTEGCFHSGSNPENLEISSVARPPASTSNAFYTSNRAPLMASRLIKLPVGSIEPRGWIKKCLELQRDGLAGHLQEISIWLDKKNNAWFSADGKGDRGWEEVPYWLKGFGDLGYVLKDDRIVKETKLWLEKVFASQREDGSFGPMAVVKAFGNNNKGTNPDLWPNMIMLWCLQSYYDYSNDPRVIPFMTKYFKWENGIPGEKLLKLYWENSRGGDNLYSVYWLYNRTGKPWLLDLASKIHKNTANWMQQGKLPNWHNVNIAQGYREPAEFYLQSKDSSHLLATYNDFQLVRNMYGQVPGGMFGADENARPGYTDPRQAVETCGMVEEMASNELLTSITGDPFWADECENVAFNTFPAALMPDFKALRYLTAPNMVVSDGNNHAPGIENSGPDLMMNPFISRCCQHNHGQGWPYYAEHLWMATPDNGLAAVLYNSSKVTAKVGNAQTIELTEETHYPFSDEVTFTVHVSTDVNFPLYIRIPGWCNKATLQVNDKRIENPQPAGSYTVIKRIWKDKDVIRVKLPMEVSLRKWDKNKNSESVNYGPLTFSLKINERYIKRDSREQKENGSDNKEKWQKNVDASNWPAFDLYAGGPWNYGLNEAEGPIDNSFKVIKKDWPKNDFPFTSEAVPLEIRTEGKKIESWKIDQYDLCGVLPQSPVTSNSPSEQLVLIPMGAARLRVSAFPVIQNKTK